MGRKLELATPSHTTGFHRVLRPRGIQITREKRELTWCLNSLNLHGEKKVCPYSFNSRLKTYIGSLQKFLKSSAFTTRQERTRCDQNLSRTTRNPIGKVDARRSPMYLIPNWHLLLLIPCMDNIGSGMAAPSKSAVGADLARPSAGIKNSPKDLCSHVIFIVFFKLKNYNYYLCF